MAKNKYKKQPVKPDRKPEESVTYVSNLPKILKRKVVVVDKPCHPVQRPKIVTR